MKKGVIVILFLLLCSSIIYAEEIGSEKVSDFTIKAHFGYSILPGLTGFYFYLHLKDPFSYSSGLSLSIDFLYTIFPELYVGINASYMPICRFNESDIKVNEDMFPLTAFLCYEYKEILYFNLGMGFFIVHSIGESAYFDFVSGQTDELLGKSVDTWEGPLFDINYGLGFLIDLSGNNTFGIDLFLQAYHLFGVKNLEKLGELAEEEVSVPAFLLSMVVNSGIGIFYRF